MEQISKPSIDINEDSLIKLNNGLLPLLLIDRTTGGNIKWATQDYAHFGEYYCADCEITPILILTQNSNIIQPRVSKEESSKNRRTREKAEVFTPSWICNAQNNLIDEQWFFGKRGIFNRELNKSWQTQEEPISFPNVRGKTWQDYVDAKRMEVTCGEAPYLVSRYDSVTGEYIPVKNRIGMLDRKLRVVSENAKNEKEWLIWTFRAFEATYGYDLQGDNVLLARENLLYTFIDNCQLHLNRKPTIPELRRVATIISWNIWQMNGLTMTAPFSKKENHIEQITMFEILQMPKEPEEIECVIKDWRAKSKIIFKELSKG